MKRQREEDERSEYHDYAPRHTVYYADRRMDPRGVGESDQVEGVRQTYSDGQPNTEHVVNHRDVRESAGDFPPQYQNTGPYHHDSQPPTRQREPMTSSPSSYYRQQQEHAQAREMHPSSWSAHEQRDHYGQITPQSVGYHSSPQPPRSVDSGWGTPRYDAPPRNMQPQISPRHYSAQQVNWPDQRQPPHIPAGYNFEHPAPGGPVSSRPYMSSGNQPNTPHSIIIPSEAYPPGRDSGVSSGQYSVRRSVSQSDTGTPRYFARPAPPFTPRVRDVRGALDGALEQPHSNHSAHAQGPANNDPWQGDKGNLGNMPSTMPQHRQSYSGPGGMDGGSERYENAQYLPLPSPCTATRWSAVPPAPANEPAREHEKIAIERLQSDLHQLWGSDVEQGAIENNGEQPHGENNKDAGKQRAELRKRLLTNMREKAKASLVFESLSQFVETCHREDFLVAIPKREDGPSVGEPIALELTRQKYHQEIGFYAVVRVSVSRDLSFKVWVMQRQLWSGRLRSAWDFNVLLLRLSPKSEFSPCAGIDIRELENAQSIASRSRVLRISSYPFLVGRHQECELWIPKERSSCVRCQQLKHQVAYSARKEARMNEVGGGAAMEKPAMVSNGGIENTAGGQMQVAEMEEGGKVREGEGEGEGEGDLCETRLKGTRESSFSPTEGPRGAGRKEGGKLSPEDRKTSVSMSNPSPLMLPTSEWKDYYTGRKQSVPGQSSCESLTS